MNNSALIVWTLLIVPSAVWGVLTAYIFKLYGAEVSRLIGFAVSGAVPLIIFTMLVLYDSYFTPPYYPDKFFLVAIIFGGGAACITALIAHTLFVCLFDRRYRYSDNEKLKPSDDK
jgi:hypothetical protein